MRTNIVIDDELMAKAMKLTGIKTKREIVEEALRILISTTEQKAILGLQVKIQWDGDLNEMRQGRYFHESRAEYTVNQSQSVVQANNTQAGDNQSSDDRASDSQDSDNQAGNSSK